MLYLPNVSKQKDECAVVYHTHFGGQKDAFFRGICPILKEHAREQMLPLYRPYTCMCY